MPHRGPRVAADVLIDLGHDRFVLIARRNPPFGWAIPGGFIDEGESAERAAIREAREETGLDVELTELFNVYSDPWRDPRHHTLSVIFLGHATGEPVGGDDASEARAFTSDTVPRDLAFDHAQILSDYFTYRACGTRPEPRPSSRARLSAADRAWLLEVARSAIARSIGAGTEPTPRSPAGALDQPASAFVSLHRGGELRGCIGSFAHDRALPEVVHDMALAAAFEDPRFPPLATHELDELEIEISVLSELRPARPEAVMPGFHGVSLALHGKKGVFLPQVAREAGWDRETLLAQTCLKAGLCADAWRDPEAEIAVFTSETFAEAS